MVGVDVSAGAAAEFRWIVNVMVDKVGAYPAGKS